MCKKIRILGIQDVAVNGLNRRTVLINGTDLVQYGSFLKKNKYVFERNTPWPFSVMRKCFMEFPRKHGTNVRRLTLTTTMQCSGAVTASCCWVKAVLFVMCLVDLCYGNLNLYLTQWEVRRLLGKSFQTPALPYFPLIISST